MISHGQCNGMNKFKSFIVAVVAVLFYVLLENNTWKKPRSPV